MSTPNRIVEPFVLLRTKFQRPRLREKLVARPRLLDQLQACLKQTGPSDTPGFTRKLILVSAPAGYGKSTVVGQWLEACPFSSAWLSLDGGDSDLNVFLSYLTGAIQTTYPEACASTVSLLQSSQMPPADYLVNLLTNELLELPGKLVLALDDFHRIEGNAVPEFVARLLDHLPPQVCLVIAARQDPILPLIRMRAAGEMVELRMADLCFSHPEVQAFLEASLGPGLSPQAVRTLEERTEGWIVGLRLVALSLQEVEVPEAFVEAFQASGHRYVMEYLVDQVLSLQSPEIRNFLLQTSILDRFCVPLCDAVLARQFNQAILVELERANLFLVPLDIEGKWFRYHNLFQELLVHRLQTQFARAEIAALHSNASSWFAENELIEEALIHALAAGDDLGAARLVETNYRLALNRGQWTRLQRWLDHIPKSVIEERPGLLVAHCWCLHRGFNIAATVPVAERAAALLETPELSAELDIDADEQRYLLGEINGLRSQPLYFLGEHELGWEYAELSLTQLSEMFSYGVSGAYFYLGLHLHALGRGDEAISRLRQAIRSWPKSSPFSLHLYLSLCYITRAMADFPHFLQVGQDYLDTALRTENPESIAFAHYHLGVVYYEWNQLEEAQYHFEANLNLHYQAHQLSYLSSVQGLTLVYLAQKKYEKVGEMLAVLREYSSETESYMLLDSIDSFQARLALLQRDYDAAERLSLAAYNGPPLGPMLMLENPALTRVKVLVANATPESAPETLDLLDELLAQARITHYVWREIEVLALQTLALKTQGNADEALSRLERAVILAQPGKLLRTFVDLGPDLVELLRQLAGKGLAPKYLRHLLAAFDAEVKASQPGFSTEIIEPLTEREIEILALLGERLTNQEIAQRLVISPKTVKRHASNIYQKLGVKNRREAAAKVQEFSL